MKEDYKNIKPDSFDEMIKAKLLNHQMSVDVDCWEQIEQRLQQPKQRNKKLWIIIPFATAASIALLFTLNFYDERSNITLTNNNQHSTVQNIISKNNNITNKGLNLTADGKYKIPNANKCIHNLASYFAQEKQVNRDKSISSKNEHRNLTTSEATVSQVLESKESSEYIAKVNDISGQGIETNSVTKPSTQTSATEKKQGFSIIKNKTQTSKNIEEKRLDANKDKLKENIDINTSKWTIGALISNYGNHSYSSQSQYNTNNPPMSVGVTSNPPTITPNTGWGPTGNYGNGGTVTTTGTNPGLNYTVDQIKNAKYTVPLSLGIIFQKNLSKVFSLETGLTFCNLKANISTQKNYPLLIGNNESIKEIFSLYYLGVPLSLVCTGWKYNRWSAYVSCGGMIEKGFLYNYSVSNYNESKQLIKEEHTSGALDGFQLSVNCAGGVDYRIFNQFSVFLEPRIAYFFDNDQPLSIRTAQPVSVSVLGGVKISFQ